MFNNTYVGDGSFLSLTGQNDRKPKAKWRLVKNTKPILVCGNNNKLFLILSLTA